MTIRWDSLLVRALARELDEALTGARLRALRLDGAHRDVVMLFRSRTLRWRLHPDRGPLRLLDAVEPAPADLRVRARVRGVSAPPDERIIRFELLPERGGSAIDLIVELIGNRWNCIVTEGPDAAIRHVLVRRERPRPLRVGHPYAAPEPTRRLGASGGISEAAWVEALGPIPPEERARAIVKAVAWTSPLNATTILGAAARDPAPVALLAARERWRAFADADGPTAPVLIEGDAGPQPYPVPVTHAPLRPAASLLEAFETCAADAEARGDTPVAIALGPELVARLEESIRHHERRVTRLRAELREADDAGALRAIGDLILARYREVGTGRSSATVAGFDGAPVTIELDPALAPNENADRYYDRAGRAERAVERLPGLIHDAHQALDRFESLRSRAVAGEATAEEVTEALPTVKEGRRGASTVEALPYRSFRSSGGLEIRVGRGARHNDDLTFHHASPGDVWLHARHTAGAHVVLRWAGEGAPPARDLAEAATLAAVHSKARTSASVPVDWTYRKYVRKPRGAAPGSVVPDRVSTLFVEPNESIVERLSGSD